MSRSGPAVQQADGDDKVLVFTFPYTLGMKLVSDLNRYLRIYNQVFLLCNCIYY